MRLYDFCGTKNDIRGAGITFAIRGIFDREVGTSYTIDICMKCANRVKDMVEAKEGVPTLDRVLSIGLSLKNNVMAGSKYGNPDDYHT